MYRYSYVFNVVSSCHAMDVLSVSNFVPHAMNDVLNYVMYSSSY